MKYLFIHQNFPGQFKHLSRALSADDKNQVVAIGQKKNLPVEGVHHVYYSLPKISSKETHHYIRGFEEHVRRGQLVCKQVLELKRKGFIPDVVIAHPGWGECLFIKDVLPSAKLIYYCEFFYHAFGVDVGFDPEFPRSQDDILRVRIKNATGLFNLLDCDIGISPTQWQKQLFPKLYESKIKVIHEGVDTDKISPNPTAQFKIDNPRLTLSRDDNVITFVARSLEPYRGIHTFIRALPDILKTIPDAHVLIAGKKQVSYGRPLPGGEFYVDRFLREVEIDRNRVHFLGHLDYDRYLKLLQISSVHIYLTYPFVLSWSMLEAMAAGCVVIGSKTPPVEEVIKNGENGFLVNFFDKKALARLIRNALFDKENLETVGIAARSTIVDKYDLKTKMLPRQIEMVKNVFLE